MNTGLSSRLHPRKSSFMLSWSAVASATRKMKAQDTKRAFKPNFPNFPAIRHKVESKIFRTATNLVSKRAKFNVDFENNWLFRIVSLIVRKSEFFCKQTRIGIIPSPKANLNIFLIALKQDYIDSQYVKLPYSIWPFSIFYVLLFNRRQNVQKLNNYKYSTWCRSNFVTFC